MNEPTQRAVRSGDEPVLTGVRNFRDVGGLRTADGLRVRHGVLFRSGHLAHADEADTAFLASLGLHTVVDFRNDSDMALEGPDVELPGVRNVNMPLTDSSDGDAFWRMVRDGDLATLRDVLGDGRAAAAMTRTYRGLITERTGEHGRLLEMLSEGELPLLMHCAAGKDRAGTAMAVVLLALGVRREDITGDYLLSNDPHRRYRIRRGEGAEPVSNAEVSRLLSPLFEARAEYLDAMFATVEARWGDVERYLTEGLGLGPGRRERLRAALLEPAGAV